MAEKFPEGFSHAICQALALPLAKPGMSWANIMRSVYTLATAAAEMTVIAHMNSHQERLLAIMGGKPAAISIIEMEPEDFDYKDNLHDSM